MRIDTLRFGEIEIPDEAVLTFPAGLWAFPDTRRFCLLPYGVGHPVRWLQSLEDASLAFLSVEPHQFFPQYEINLSDADSLSLGLARAEDAVVLALLTVSHDCGAITVNLAGPIVINTRTRRAKQIIVDDPRYTAKHLIAGLNDELPDRRP
jgi:flagellar assembly factor FliW